MSDPAVPLPDGIDPSALEEVFRRATGREGGRLIDWRCRSLGTPRVASTRAVYRFHATLAVGADRVVATLVLKVLSPGADGALPREAELYRSGVLAALPHGLAAPRCHGVVPLSGGTTGLWLACLDDAAASPWSLPRFAEAARHPGELAATGSAALRTAARAVPRRDLCARQDLAERSIAELQAAAGQPLARRAYPPAVAAGLRRLWEARGPLLAALGRVPTLLCHGDAQRRNLFAASGEDGHGGTVAVDWANFATAPAGIDAATLVHYALVYFDVAVSEARPLERQVFAGYLAGLRDAGWPGDERTIRSGYLTQLTLGLGLLEVQPVLRLVRDGQQRAWAERWYGRPLEEVLDRRSAVAEFLLDLGREALTLASVPKGAERTAWP